MCKVFLLQNVVNWSPFHPERLGSFSPDIETIFPTKCSVSTVFLPPFRDNVFRAISLPQSLFLHWLNHATLITLDLSITRSASCLCHASSNENRSFSTRWLICIASFEVKTTSCRVHIRPQCLMNQRSNSFEVPCHAEISWSYVDRKFISSSH